MTAIVHLLIALVAAKIAAELSERIKVPAVVGEIVAGLIIGPSALGILPHDEVLTILGEVGVILLLLDVGLEMDLKELASVGRAALLVAVVGVVAPFGMGIGVGLAFDMSGNEALFVGAALTATSVGITARVFGDLRALATVEARTVLGAAVADDVIGLVILTVVVRLVTAGSVSALDVGQVVLVAVVFLVGTSLIGVRLAPPAFEWLARVSKSGGTLVALALAFTLGLAKLADAAKLAPIVGAFVAGISLSQSKVAERVHRELTPVGQLLIPVFFLQIGVNADVGQFAKPAVLGLAAALLTVAIIGKLVSPIGMWGAPGDRLLVGMAMIPRGEVGLIFATIGLQQGVFGENVYASVLLVVLATTLLTPPLLRWRIQRTGSSSEPAAPPVARPPGGWLTVEPHALGSVVELVHEPPSGETLEIALAAARQLEASTPGPQLMDWLARQEPTPLRWTPTTRALFFDVLEHAGARSWRFLSVTRVLERCLPELAAAVVEREDDTYGFDPLAGLDWPTLVELRDVISREALDLDHADWLMLAAVVADATVRDSTRSVVVARRTAERLDLGARAQESIAGLVRDLPLFTGTARSLNAFGEVRDLQLAQHIGSKPQVRALFALCLASNPGEVTLHQRLRALEQRLLAVLDHPELAGREAANLLEIRRSSAVGLLDGAAHAEARVRSAPRALVLSQPAAALAQQAVMAERLGEGRGPMVEAHGPIDDELWRVDVAAPDQRGLLARLARALHLAGHDVRLADLGTWDDGTVVVSFRTLPSGPLVEPELVEAIRSGLGAPLSGQAHPGAAVSWDDALSPWHTVCGIAVQDEPGLLADLASAFAASGVEVHAAHVASADGEAVNTFDVSDQSGGRLDPATRERVEVAIRSGTAAGERRSRWAFRVGSS